MDVAVVLLEFHLVDGSDRDAAAALHHEPGRVVDARQRIAGAAVRRGRRSCAVDPDPAAAMAPLVESVRTLIAERDRLAVRISKIERHLDDLTGSIKAQPAAAPTGAARTLPQPTPESVGAPAAGSAPQATAPASSDPPRPAIEPSANRTEAPLGTPSAAERLSSIDAFNLEYGIDIGGAANFEGLRQLWTATKASNAALLEGLYGVVALRENSRTKAAELRLIVGPFADPEAANRACVALTTARRYCQPAGFEGQRLADAEKASERKPAPKPVSRTPRLFGLFQ